MRIFQKAGDAPNLSKEKEKKSEERDGRIPEGWMERRYDKRRIFQ